MFDERGIVERSGKQMPRRGPVPCETSIGCEKGHWKTNPDLSPGEAIMIDLYQSSKATGGQSLNGAERDSDFLVECFSGFVEIEQIVEDKKHARDLNTMMARLRKG